MSAIEKVFLVVQLFFAGTSTIIAIERWQEGGRWKLTAACAVVLLLGGVFRVMA